MIKSIIILSVCFISVYVSTFFFFFVNYIMRLKRSDRYEFKLFRDTNHFFFLMICFIFRHNPFKHSVILNIDSLNAEGVDLIFWLEQNIGLLYFKQDISYINKSLNDFNEQIKSKAQNMSAPELIDILNNSCEIKIDFVRESDAVLFKLTWG